MTVIKLNGLTKNDPKNLLIKPQLSILVLNIMPNKAQTEQQISRLFAEVKTPVSVTFMYPKSHVWKHGDQSKLSASYATLDDLKDKYFDGFIVTGAPVEQIKFTDVDYWDEFLEIRDWAHKHTQNQLFKCWGAQAALFADFEVPKVNVKEKIFGVYKNQINTTHLPRNFLMPQSRFSKVETSIVESIPQLEILADNVQTGSFFMRATDRNSLYIMGHPEYTANTLIDEYHRDLKKNQPIKKPVNISLENPLKSYIGWHNSSLDLYQGWLDQIQKERINHDRKQLQI
ncbi:homoserine O-acetyltransferase/O-succinyltransferase family protein [Companilactobacillus furfuricola]|uniref:homoserine O-acetyltransferase/O-succinyltransferase family protein n=1 Tax=Companilactobacillus furfuricola TaxID=1462575 RepID=UPI000F79078D|nr:homoserine O-succinyltransferase [Companilactobacillus furfuricola]